MPVIAITFEGDDLLAGEIFESGCIKEGMTLAADARIKTEADPLGVGPLVYKEKPTDENGKVDKTNGSVRGAQFLFFTDTDVRRGALTGQDPADVDLTITDFLTNSGGERAAMIANAPAIG